MARCSNWALQLWIMLEEAIAEGEIIVMGTKGLQKATFFFFFLRTMCCPTSCSGSSCLRAPASSLLHLLGHACGCFCLRLCPMSLFSVHLAAQSSVTGFKSFNVCWSGLYSNVTVISLGAIKSHFPLHTSCTQSKWVKYLRSSWFSWGNPCLLLSWCAQFFKTLGFAAGSLIIQRPQCLVKGWTHGPCRTSRDVC